MPATRRLPDLDPSFAGTRAIGAGAISALAYLGVMYADMALTGSPSNDLLMLGRVATSDQRRAICLGFVAHTGFGISLSLIYAAYGRRALPGPPWARGLAILMAENTLLWPLAVAADRLHPAMRAGELPLLNRPVSIGQQVARHIAFGLALGLLYGEGKTRPET
ncbi:MAG TPA: DUF6789 family protein [Chloroflexota bacterium]|nr:DUF6789 family protein [Chloroflexota bacterium]